MNTMRRVLVLAPHTDDAELGCGGTIARLLTDGADVLVAAFSTAEGIFTSRGEAKPAPR